MKNGNATLCSQVSESNCSPVWEKSNQTEELGEKVDLSGYMGFSGNQITTALWPLKQEEYY